MIAARSAFLSLDEDNPVNWDHPINVGMRACYKAIGGTGFFGGNTLRDMCRRKYPKLDGSPTSGMLWDGTAAPNQYGSLRFNGSNYINCGGATELDVTTGDFAFCAAVSYVGTGQANFLIDKTTGPGANGYQILLGISSTTGMVSFRMNNSIRVDSAGPWNDGHWHLILCTRLSGTIYMYIDGGSRGSAAFSTSITNTSASLQIGARNGGSIFTGGYINDVCVWPSRGFSAADATQHYVEWLQGDRHRFNWLSRRSYSFAAGGGGGGFAFNPSLIRKRKSQSILLRM